MLNRNSTLGPGHFGWDQQCALQETLPVEGTVLWHAGAVDQPCSGLILRRLDETKLEDDSGYTCSALQQLRNACRGGPLHQLFGFMGLFLLHPTACQNWSGWVCQALSKTKGGQPFQLFLAKYILRIPKQLNWSQRCQLVQGLELLHFCSSNTFALAVRPRQTLYSCQHHLLGQRWASAPRPQILLLLPASARTVGQAATQLLTAALQGSATAAGMVIVTVPCPNTFPSLSCLLSRKGLAMHNSRHWV